MKVFLVLSHDVVCGVHLEKWWRSSGVDLCFGVVEDETRKELPIVQ